MSRAWLSLCVLAVAGCSAYVERQAAATTYRIVAASVDSARRGVDVELARAAMPSGVLQLEAFAHAYPDHAGLQALYADAYCQYAVVFVFDDWEDAQLAGRAAAAARLEARLGPLLERCRALNLDRLPPAWRAADRTGSAALRAQITAATRADQPAMLGLATAAAVQLAVAPLRHLPELPLIEAMLARSAQLAPGFHDAEAELLLATLAAARGQAMGVLLGGGDGSAEFARARTAAGDGALIVDVMFARGVAVARKDRPLFEATLGRVLAADVTRWPDRRLANELARDKARRYLAAAAALVPQ